MPNAYANKVQVTRGGQTETLIDLTADTAIASDVAQGKYFHLASGERVVGTATGGGGAVYQDQDGFIVLSDQGGGSSVTVEALSVTQNGTYTAQSGHAYSPVTVNVSGGGAESKAVEFHDYDGTIVASYTKTEFAALTALPSNPSHTGLTAQGWNWSLSDAKTYIQTHDHLSIGQMYVTSSGKTEVDIVLEAPYLSPYLMLAPNGTVTIDWGDGSSTDTMTGTSYTSSYYQQHVYAQAGAYTIAITVESGGFTFYNGSQSYAGMLRMVGASNGRSHSRTYSNDVQAVRIGTGVDRLGYGAFANCTSMEYVTVSASVTSIGSYAFYDCFALTSIVIPSGVTNIDNYTFQNCYAITSVNIPSSVTSIGTSAFHNCYSLTSIDIPSGVTNIGNSTFQNCYVLTSIDIPSGVTSIGTSAFSGCYALTSIDIPSSVTSIGNSAFYGCYTLASIDIPSGVTSIGTNAFQYCYALTSIDIPSGVTSIGTGTFQACYALTSIDIPSSVTSIGTGAFSGCHALTSVSIPSSVTSIGTNAFNSCYGVLEYHLLPETPPTAGTTMFANIFSGTVIYVPQGCLSDYQSADNWSTYASYMQEEAA